MIGILFFVISNFATGQSAPDSLPPQVTLSQCIDYALKNQSLVKQSLVDEDITKRDIRIALSGWYPQLEVDGNLQNYLQIPTAPYPIFSQTKPYVPVATYNFPTTTNYVSTGLISANQTLYSSSLFFAIRTSRDVRAQASQNTESSKINTYVDVTVAFYDVLLAEQQLNVLNEDIIRLERNYKDAYNLYQDGLTDNIDYQRAEISLSNTQAQKKSTEEAIKAKYAVLKQMMGVLPEKQITLLYDTTKYESEILMDTTKTLDYSNRIEYKLLETSLKLQGTQISYYKWSFLPTISAFYNYVPTFYNEQFSGLYNMNIPSSVIGLKFTLPLFQGLNRLENLSKAKLQYQRLQLGMDYLKSEINSEYTQALTSYISNLNELRIAKKNKTIASRIYNTVKYQYDKGIKAYLEVIVSETDLRTAELTYLNELFQVLNSKMEFEKALGVIRVN